MLLNVLWTHLEGAAVDRQLAYLHSVAPQSCFLVCHAGRREDFDRVHHRNKVFIDDDSLRTTVPRDQSPVELLTRVYDFCLAHDGVDAVFLIEYDHLILRGDFEQAIEQLLDVSGADFLGKNCVLKDGNNWMHSIRARRDPEFMAFLRGLTVRDGPPRLYGCLGSGFVVRRAALAHLVTVDPPKLDYHEMYLPTVLYHLGYRLADIDEISDIYAEMTCRPIKNLRQVIDAKRQGHFFVHPFKDLNVLDKVLSAPAARPR